MKFLIACCVVICVAGVLCNNEDDYPKKPPQALVKRCARRHDVDNVMIDEIKTKKSFHKSRKVQCFADCLLGGSGIVIRGEVNDDFTNSTPGQQCKDWSGKDVCEKSANMLGCLFQKNFMAMPNDEDDFPKKPPQALVNRCARRHDIDNVTIDEIKTKKSFHKSREVQCFAACLLDKSGIVIRGEVNDDFTNSTPGRQCKDWSGKDVCEMSAKMLGCLFEKNFMAMPSITPLEEF